MTARIKPRELPSTLRALGLGAVTDQGALVKALKARRDDPVARAALSLVETLDGARLRRLFDATPTSAAAAKVAAQVPGSGVGGAGRLRFDVEKGVNHMRSPEAARGAALYLDADARPEVARPLERVLTHVTRLHDAMCASADVGALIDSLVATDARRHLFALQSLARIYADAADDAGGKTERGIDKVLERTKELEDALGAYGYAMDLVKGTAGKALPEETRALLDDAVTKSRRALAAVLEDGWLPEGGTVKRLEKVTRAFAELAVEGHLQSEKRDARELRGALADLCEKIADKELDMTDLEGGLHELRRQLRWIPITMMALDGLVRLDPGTDPIPAFAPLKKDAIADTPFGKLPASTHERVAIDVPQSLFLQLSKVIGELGKAKDRGQLIEGLAHALVESGAAKKKDAEREAERLLGDPGGMQHVYAEAERIAAALESSDLLRTVARGLRGA